VHSCGSLYARFGEFIRCYDANYVTEYTAGERGYVGVSFGTATQRDVLVDLFVGDRWVASSRRTVGPGSGSDTLAVDVPSLGSPAVQGHRVREAFARGRSVDSQPH
jgi:hypothetical protein